MIEIVMSYEPLVSVNRDKTRLGFRRARPRKWLRDFGYCLSVEVMKQGMSPSPLLVGIEIVAPDGPGRLPDTENFRKPIHDVIASVLMRDDQQFVPWQEESPAARRAKPGEESDIIVRIRSTLDAPA